MTEELLADVATVEAAPVAAPAGDHTTRAPDGPARPRDHAEIDRLASSLVPELIARLSATGLGEIEIHQDDWKVRVRRPAHAAPARGPVLDAGGSSVPGRRQSGLSRAQAGHVAHDHAPRVAERAKRVGGAASPEAARGNGASHRPDVGVPVTSPAVGIYRPGKQQPGTTVSAGDRIAAVDMLGVPQDVVAPADGVLGESVVEAGEAVEYGQELMRIEPAEVRT